MSAPGVKRRAAVAACRLANTPLMPRKALDRMVRSFFGEDPPRIHTDAMDLFHRALEEHLVRRLEATGALCKNKGLATATAADFALACALAKH